MILLCLGHLWAVPDLSAAQSTLSFTSLKTQCQVSLGSASSFSLEQTRKVCANLQRFLLLPFKSSWPSLSYSTDYLLLDSLEYLIDSKRWNLSKYD